MSENNKWWQIYEKDVMVLRKALEESGHKEALHDLESGINTTDYIQILLVSDETVVSVRKAIEESGHEKALAVLASELYETDMVPDDFKEEP